MKKIDFSAIEVEMSFGEPRPADIRKELGNLINRSTSDIALADIARAIYYSEGPVDVPDQYAGEIAEIVRGSSFIAPAKSAVIRLLAPEQKKPVKK